MVGVPVVTKVLPPSADSFTPWMAVAQLTELPVPALMVSWVIFVGWPSTP